MAGPVTLRTIGRWDKQIGVPLESALAVSMEIMGRTGEEACKHALILMAQSARAITPQSKKKRRVRKDKHGRYVEALTQRNHDGRKLYEWMFSELNPKKRRGTFEQAQEIGRRGLAKQSWMWGLKSLGKPANTKEIPGVARVYSVTSTNLNGYVEENALSYVTKIMPAGWEKTVELRAGNKIMNAAARKLESKWRREVGAPKGQKIGRPDVSKYFLRQIGSL